MRSRLLGLALCLCLPGCGAVRQEPAVRPLKALYLTGGGYHDYEVLAPLLTAKLSELANVTFDVKWGFEPLQDPRLGDGYDLIVYNMCGADNESGENCARLTREGKPAVMVHCAMHCFRKTPAWQECCGMKSVSHEKYQAFGTIKVDTDHPVMKAFPDDWKTPGDELYNTVEFHKSARALLKVKSPSTGSEAIVCWTNQYGQGRVFATTLGHDLKTASLPSYHALLAHGLLWVCGKLGDDGRPLAGYGAPGAK